MSEDLANVAVVVGPAAVAADHPAVTGRVQQAAVGRVPARKEIVEMAHDYLFLCQHICLGQRFKVPRIY